MRTSATCLLGLLAFSAIASFPHPGFAQAPSQDNILFIFDASGSMKANVAGGTRIDIAKAAMQTALKDMPASSRLGLLMYGHRRAKDCTDIEMVSPIGADDAAKIATTISGVQPKGETPIGEALRQAARNFSAFKGQNNSIVLVTDGIEECKGDPCAQANEIKAAGLDLKVHVVGFTLNDAQRKAIQCVPDTTGGTYFEAKDATGLNRALSEVRQQTAAAAPPQTTTAITPPKVETNLLSPAAGGRLLMAPKEDWKGLADGKPDRVTLYQGEAVWAFKDGKPATFDALEFMVKGADQYNIKDVEVLVGDDGPMGTFRSVGTLVVENTKPAGGEYQKFTLPPTTAKFFKINVTGNWGGGYAAGYEIRLSGKVDDAAPAAAKPEPATGVDLLSPANGGTLIYAPNADWEKLTNGKGERATTYSGDGVWRFKDGKPAAFDRIEVLIPATEQYSLKEFEVFAGDESPTGAFRSLGTFTTVNARMLETPYQAFALPKTTARYVKVSYTAHWGGGYVAGYGLRLFGTVDDSAPAAPPLPAGGTDLIANANGGLLLSSSSEEWKKLTDGSKTRATSRPGGEAVWAFKDEQPATISAVEVLIPAYEDYTLKEFEVLVSADNPMGPFTSLGTFTTVNARFRDNNQYQRFELPPTKAKYVKLVAKSYWGGGYIAMHGFRVMGTLGP